MFYSDVLFIYREPTKLHGALILALFREALFILRGMKKFVISQFFHAISFPFEKLAACHHEDWFLNCHHKEYTFHFLCERTFMPLLSV